MKKCRPFNFLTILLGICFLAGCEKEDNPDPSFDIPTSVDLGLSVNWASHNLGAAKPKDSGSYYQWAGTEDITSGEYFLNWSYCPYHTGTSSGSGFTKYNSNPSYGTVDNKTVLDPGDDVANKELGGNWRMPTDAEWMELLDNCTWTWDMQEGVCGYTVVSKKPGYTDKSIFLPAAGYRHRDGILGKGYGGSYWSSSLSRSTTSLACSLWFIEDEVKTEDKNRCYGFPVRPVEQK